MAIAFNAASGVHNTVNQISQTFSHTCAGTDRYLLVWVITDNSTAASGSTVTYNGVSMTALGIANRPAIYIRLFGMVNPPAGTYNVVATLGVSRFWLGVGATSWTGVHQASPLGTVATANGTTTSLSVTASSATSEVVAGGFGYLSSSGPTATIGGGQTQRHIDQYEIGGTYAGLMASSIDGASSVSLTYSLSSTPAYGWAGVAVPLKPAASGTSHALTGDIAATSAVAGALALAQPLTGSIVSGSTVAGDLRVARPLTGDVAATSVVTGSMRLAMPLSGSAAATSTVAGDATLAASLTGNVDGTSALTASLALSLPLTGEASSSSAVAGSMAVARPLTGAMAASAVVTGDIGVALPLSGTIASTSSVAGSIDTTAELELAGGVAATSSITGALTLTYALTSAVISNSAATGDVGLSLPLAGTVHADSAMTSDIILALGLNGVVWALGDVSGALTTVGPSVPAEPLHVDVTRTFNPMPVAAVRTFAALPVGATRTVQPMPVAVTREFDQ